MTNTCFQSLAESNVLLSCGAAGGLNVVLKALLDPGDEVIAIVPYFPEYRFYVSAHGGVLKLVESQDNFQPDSARLAQAITARTKAIIVNSPNNPTGVVYTEQATRELVQVLQRGPQRVSGIPYTCWPTISTAASRLPA